jgi:hypothetical protein
MAETFGDNGRCMCHDMCDEVAAMLEASGVKDVHPIHHGPGRPGLGLPRRAAEAG